MSSNKSINDDDLDNLEDEMDRLIDEQDFMDSDQDVEPEQP